MQRGGGAGGGAGGGGGGGGGGIFSLGLNRNRIKRIVKHRMRRKMERFTPTISFFRFSLFLGSWVWPERKEVETPLSDRFLFSLSEAPVNELLVTSADDDDGNVVYFIRMLLEFNKM